MPLLVMLIAFMSTMIISAPVRDAFSNISFTFELPQFSFTNPLHFFQIALDDLTQFGFMIWGITQMFANAFSQGFNSAANNVSTSTFTFANFISFCASLIWSAIQFAVHEIATVLGIIAQFFTTFALSCVKFIDACLSITTHSAVAVGQWFAKTMQNTVQLTIFISLVLIHYAVIVILTIWDAIIFTGKLISNAVITSATYIGSVIAHVTSAIIHVIEIPFKVLYAFWLLIKPYVAIFGNHVKMSGGDFSNMFTSLGKVASLVSRPK